MNTPTVYISAALPEVEYANEVALHLKRQGVENTAGWIAKTIALGEQIDPTDEAMRKAILADNMADVQRATAVVLLANVGVPRAAHWDACYGYGLGKRVFWVHSQSGRGRNLWDVAPGISRMQEGMDAKQTAAKLVSRISRELGGVRRTA